MRVSSSPSAIAPRITSAEDCRARLAGLDLTPEDLCDAIRDAENSRAQCTAFDPKQFPGVVSWAGTVRAVRQRLVPQHWEIFEFGGISAVRHPSGNFAIVVSTGTSATATTSPVQTKHKKGRKMQDLVELGQLALFEYRTFKRPPAADAPPCEIWVLLFHRKPAVSVIEAELSLADGFDEQGRIAGWRERIFLPSLNIDWSMPSDESDEDGSYDVDVKRK